ELGGQVRTDAVVVFLRALALRAALRDVALIRVPHLTHERARFGVFAARCCLPLEPLGSCAALARRAGRALFYALELVPLSDLLALEPLRVAQGQPRLAALHARAVNHRPPVDARGVDARAQKPQLRLVLVAKVSGQLRLELLTLAGYTRARHGSAVVVTNDVRVGHEAIPGDFHLVDCRRCRREAETLAAGRPRPENQERARERSTRPDRDE